MTVAIETARTEYTQTIAGTVTFTFPFKIWDADDVRITTVSAAGVETLLVLSSDYVVSGVGLDTGGSITLVSAPAVGNRVVIERILEVVQLSSFKTQGKFSPKFHENAFDRLIQVVQQMEALLKTRSPAAARIPILTPGGVSGQSAFEARGNRMANLADPVNPQDAATKNWVENSVVSGVVQVQAVYTMAPDTRPAANTMPGQFIRVKDTGLPEVLQFSQRNASGIYEWIPVSIGGL